MVRTFINAYADAHRRAAAILKMMGDDPLPARTKSRFCDRWDTRL